MQICCGALKKIRKKMQQEPEKNTFWKDVYPLNNFTSVLVCMQSHVQICCGALKIKKNATQQQSEENTIWNAVHPLNNSTSLCVCMQSCMQICCGAFQKKKKGARKEHHLDRRASAQQFNVCLRVYAIVYADLLWCLKKKNQQEPEKNTIWKAVHPLNNSTSVFVCMQLCMQICFGALKKKKTGARKEHHLESCASAQQFDVCV